MNIEPDRNLVRRVLSVATGEHIHRMQSKVSAYIGFFGLLPSSIASQRIFDLEKEFRALIRSSHEKSFIPPSGSPHGLHSHKSLKEI